MRCWILFGIRVIWGLKCNQENVRKWGLKWEIIMITSWRGMNDEDIEKPKSPASLELVRAWQSKDIIMITTQSHNLVVSHTFRFWQWNSMTAAESNKKDSLRWWFKVKVTITLAPELETNSSHALNHSLTFSFSYKSKTRNSNTKLIAEAAAAQPAIYLPVQHTNSIL